MRAMCCSRSKPNANSSRPPKSACAWLPSSDEIQELQHEISAEEQAIEQTRRASRAAVAEATERLSAAEAAARQAQDK